MVIATNQDSNMANIKQYDVTQYIMFTITLNKSYLLYFISYVDIYNVRIDVSVNFVENKSKTIAIL